MGRKRYTEAFKVEAVRQVTDGGYGVYEVASRLGISNKSVDALSAMLKTVRHAVADGELDELLAKHAEYGKNVHG